MKLYWEVKGWGEGTQQELMTESFFNLFKWHHLKRRNVLHWIFLTYNEKSFGIDIYMFVAGHLSCVFNTLTLEEGSVGLVGFSSPWRCPKTTESVFDFNNVPCHFLGNKLIYCFPPLVQLCTFISWLVNIHHIACFAR